MLSTVSGMWWEARLPMMTIALITIIRYNNWIIKHVSLAHTCSLLQYNMWQQVDFHENLATTVFIECFRTVSQRRRWPPLQYSCLENPMDGGAWWAAAHGVARNWTWLSDFTFTLHFLHWKRKWQPTPAFLPGESQGRGSLVGCRLWGRTESNTTEMT